MKKSYVYAIIAVLIWSNLAAVAKSILFDIPNLEALSISSFFAFLFLLIVNIKKKTIKDMKFYSLKEYGIMVILGFIGLFVYSSMYYYGLSKLSSQEACILNYLWPIMLVIFSCIFLKEKMTFMKILAMILSFIGVIILSSNIGDINNGGKILGVLSCIIAAACYGLFSVLNKKADFNQNIAMMIMWLATAICAMVLGLFIENWVIIQGTQWIGIIFLGAIIDGFAYLLWALALKESENTAAVANFAYLTPFLSLVVSSLFLNEKIELKAIISLVFIIGGIFIQYLFDKENKI